MTCGGFSVIFYFYAVSRSKFIIELAAQADPDAIGIAFAAGFYCFTRTVTRVSTDSFRTGIWIGIWCYAPFLCVYIFTAARSFALRARGL